MKILNWLLPLSAIGVIAACGGGGGDAGTSPFGTVTGCSSTSSASAASGASSCVSASKLTLQLSTSSIENTGASPVTATATATSSSGQSLSGVPIAFSVDNGATFTLASAATGSNGQATATVSIGADPSNRVVTVTARSGNLTATAPFAVTGATLTGTRLPATVLPGASGRVDFRLVNANGTAIVGQAISITAGSLGTTTGVTGTNGDYSYVYTAPAAVGNLDIVATAGGVSSVQTVVVQSSTGSIPAAIGPIQSASVAANPSVVSTNTTATTNRTEIRALFVGGANTPIANVRVRFDLNGDPTAVGGMFSTGTSTVYSDASGIATSAYIPGTRSSPTNGVTIRACYDVVDFAASACPNMTTTTITIVSEPLSVTIGTNGLIENGPNSLTYIRKYVILVVDASGRAKANVDVIPSIDLPYYFKGQFGSTAPRPLVAGFRCANEDLNRNAILEAGDDVNGNGSLEPRKSDAAVSVLGTGKTDAAGSAIVQVEYPQNVANWLQIDMLVSANGISGTEGRARWIERLPVPVEALTAAGDPPFKFSPYGVMANCANPN